MSAKAQRELIKGGPRGAISKREKESNANPANGIPVTDHTERDKIIERLKDRR